MGSRDRRPAVSGPRFGPALLRSRDEADPELEMKSYGASRGMMMKASALIAALTATGIAFAPAAAPAAAPQTSERSPSREGDLELAESAYVMKSPAFSTEARRRALAFIHRQKTRVAAMTPEAFLLCVLAIPAFADNGHDVMNDSEGSWSPSARLPLRMLWFPGGWIVARTAPELSPLLGARVLAIEGLASDEVFRRVRRLQGGPDASRRWNLEWVIEDAGMLHALGIAQRADRLRLDLKLPD